MTVFAIIRDGTATNNSTLSARIAKRFPDAFYAVEKGQWLISTDLSAREIGAELKIEKGGTFTGTLILQVASYYGLHNKKLWTWLREYSAKG